jgi:outer membrane protein assembly factor BamA
VLKLVDYPGFDYTYHKGRAYLLRLDSDQRSRKVASDIHPQGGWRGYLQYSRENNRFLEGFEIETDKGTLVEVYNRYNYHRIETDIDYYHKLYRGVVLNPRLIGGWISDNSVDDFYHLYAGGLPGLRGYTFYSIDGTKSFTGRMTLRFPLLTGIDKRWGPFYVDRIHGALFAEAGNAWTQNFELDDLKRDIGAELRLKLYSWYGFPTDIQFTAAYGLDEFEVSNQTYGKTWRWYFTLLFDFI